MVAKTGTTYFFAFDSDLLLVVPDPLRPDDLVGATALEASLSSLAASLAPPSLVVAVFSFCFALSAAEEDGCGCCFLPFFPLS